MKNIFLNLEKVIQNKIWIIWIFSWFLILWIPSYLITWRDSSSMRLWMWDEYYFSVMFLDIFLVVLFWIFIWATIYKIKFFWNKKASKLWIIWWFLWSLVTGCTSCSITLATYLGLAWVISLLPYGWLELKIISILLLVYACYQTLKNLEVCSLKV